MNVFIYIFHDEDDEHEEHSSLSEAMWFGCNWRGPHMRTVPSSEADANIDGYTGFQLTQFTVRVWPTSLASGSSRRICHM